LRKRTVRKSRRSKSRQRDTGRLLFGTWQLVDIRTGELVAADAEMGFGLSLEQLEERIRKGRS
jgi:hypothetical protein